MTGPRVLVVASVLGIAPSGVARQAAHILPRAAEHLAALGGELVLLEGRGRVPGLSDVPRIRAPIPMGPPLLRWLAERRALARVLQEASQKGRPFQVVHQGHLPFAADVVDAQGARAVWMLHDLRRGEVGPAWARFGARRLWRTTASHSSAVVLVSESMRAAWLALSLDGGRPAYAVPNAADHLDVLPRHPVDPPYVLGVGHLEPRKGWDTAILAFGADPALGALWIAGTARGRRASDYRRKLLAQGAPLGSRLRLLEAVSDRQLSELYAGAAAVVLPSHREGFSIAALEAQRAGAPLVASDIPAHREVAAAGAWYFPPGDPAALASALCEALSDPTARARAAMERAAHYRWERSARALVEVWQRAAGSEPKAG